ncbi:hypothetical protein [Roseicyclus mahoneyensis]|uniref:TRAP transporter TAXI family solute receptor n=1 Tax=Roseicyclus mahoneyensis TaxID=164332 RepID=A0A316GB94_9RHOB|nr:hypothetical protein C7455_110122 [Roseicyclus mahoneyensis]
MRINALRARPRRRGKPKDDSERSVIADTILDRDCHADRPNQNWQAAFTEVLPSGTIRAMAQNANVNGLQTWGANLVAVPWMPMADAGVEEQVVQDMIRVCHTGKEALGTSFGAFNGADFDNMAPANVMPYHPGATRYHKGVGMPKGN